MPKIAFDEEQQRAIDKCCKTGNGNRVVAVTGEAGTGKTTIIQEVYDRVSPYYETVLCAPTGKAAKRIQEVTGIPAMTIHRLLEYPHPGDVDPETGKTLLTTDPRRHAHNRLEYKVVLADEYAMVNTAVHRNLFNAIPDGGMVRVFGDANQLAPIEPAKSMRNKPSPFQVLLDKFDGIWLETLHRQGEGSSIVSNGRRILSGQMPKRTDEFQLKVTVRPVEAVIDHVMDSKEFGDIDYTSLDNQIISPNKVGWVGTEALSSSIQALLHDASEGYFEVERHSWATDRSLPIYVGDKVIFTTNNYGLGVFNGESGLVYILDEEGIHIDFGDRIVIIPPYQEVETKRGTSHINPQKDIDLAYVVTTHKCQGSEYQNVLYVLNKSRSFIQCRRNFYTAISRARKGVLVVSDQESLSYSITRRG